MARWLLARPVDAAALREVTRSRARLVDAYEAERRRIERDLHDGAQPRLTSLTLQLGLARLDVPEDSPGRPAARRGARPGQGSDGMLRQLVHGIRPQSLTDLGLAGAVRELADAATIPVAVARRPARRAARAGRDHRLLRGVRGAGQRGPARRGDPGRGTAHPGRRRPRRRGDRRRPRRRRPGPGHRPDRARRPGRRRGRPAAAASPPGGPTLVRVELPCRGDPGGARRGRGAAARGSGRRC